MRIRPYVFLVPALVVSLLAAGCGSASSSTTPTTVAAGSAPNGNELDVVSRAYSFTPKTITVKAGTATTLVLSSKDLAHDFTVDELHIHVHTDGGKTTRGAVRFDQPGNYTFYCSITGHRAAGMVGTLIVQG
jgi:plastocyanin